YLIPAQIIDHDDPVITRCPAKDEKKDEKQFFPLEVPYLLSFLTRMGQGRHLLAELNKFSIKFQEDAVLPFFAQLMVEPGAGKSSFVLMVRHPGSGYSPSLSSR
ncbi:MAG: hypothetical protein WC369_08640, partial [Dehalococcoidales bacterium]